MRLRQRLRKEGLRTERSSELTFPDTAGALICWVQITSDPCELDTGRNKWPDEAHQVLP